MHAANPYRSARLGRVLALLRDGRAHSTREIVEAAHVVAVNSCIAECRQWGCEIETSRVREGGRTVYRYRLRSDVRCSVPRKAQQSLL